MMRERKKGVREVVQKCMLVAKRESTAKHRSESLSLPELVLLCLQAVEENMKNEEKFRQIVKLNKNYDNDNNYRSNYDKNEDNNDNFEDNNNSNSNDTYKSNKSNDDNDDYGNIVAVSRNQNKNESSFLNRNSEGKDKYHIKEREEQICGEKHRRAKLAQKLLEHPATYLAVLDILGNVRNVQHRTAAFIFFHVLSQPVERKLA